jgi:hypothetical protein
LARVVQWGIFDPDFWKMFSYSRKRGGADAFENDPSFRSKGTVGGPMGTAHGAEELGLCSHGYASGAWGHQIGFCPGYGHIWTKIKSGPAGKKYSARLITLYHNDILTSGFFRVSLGALPMRIVVSCEEIAWRASELLAKTGGVIFYFFTFSTY